MKIIESVEAKAYEGAIAKGLQAARELRDSTAAKLGRAIKQAGEDIAFDAITEFSGTAIEKREALSACNSDLVGYRRACGELQADAEAIKAIDTGNSPQSAGHADPGIVTQAMAQPVNVLQPMNSIEMRRAQAGFMAHKLFAGIKQRFSGTKLSRNDLIGHSTDLPDFSYSDLSPMNATFTRSAGWDPEVIRSGRVELHPVYKRARLQNVLPSIPVSTKAYSYMRQTRRAFTASGTGIASTGTADPARVEGTVAQEVSLQWAEQTETVESNAVFIKMTMEQLEDVEAAEMYVRQELFEMLMMTVDQQLMAGNGTAPQISGFLNRVGTADWDIGNNQFSNNVISRLDDYDTADNTVNATVGFLRTLSEQVDDTMIDGDADPNLILLHQKLWSAIRTCTSKEGVFLMGPPSDATPMSLWGTPIMMHQHFPALANSSRVGMIGDWNRAAILDRKGATLAFTDSDSDDFQKLLITLRVDLRIGLAVWRGPAFRGLQAGATL